MKTPRLLLLLAVVLISAPVSRVFATTLAVALDIQGQGLAMSSGGVGLDAIGSGTRNLTVSIGGPVQGALLYWAGRDRPCPENPAGTCVIPSQPYKDQVLSFEGNTITGTIIGTEGQPVTEGGPVNNIGYLADVTSIVQAKGTGVQSFAISDGNLANNLWRLDGASLLVIYSDPADTATYRLIIFDGLDFAYGADPTPGPTQMTVPVTFNHGADTVARTAQLLLAVGDATATGPDRIDISNNPSIVNGLDSDNGFFWDDDVSTINIPAGVASTTVQVVSPASAGAVGCGPGYWKNHTDAWAGTGYAPGQTVGSVFSGASAFPSLASKTLLQTLQGSDGRGTLGGARTLLRAAVAALLNAAHAELNYPRTTAEILADVNAALLSNNRATMLALAEELASDNNLGCFGTVAADNLLWQVAALRVPVPATGP